SGRGDAVPGPAKPGAIRCVGRPSPVVRRGLDPGAQMTRFRPLAFAAGGLAVAAVVLVTSGTGSDSLGTTPASASQMTPELAALASEPRPVATLLAAAGAQPQPTPPDVRDQWESSTTDCMTAQGFDYTPVDWRALDAAVAAARSQFARDATQMMTNYGYG